jgi:hypothetical protein
VRLVALVRQRRDLTLIPPAGLKLSLDGAGTGTPPARPPAAGKASGRARKVEHAPSWWTARAREGEVRPGFTKQEMLRPAKDDPRAPGGVFERVGGLLSELLEQV